MGRDGRHAFYRGKVISKSDGPSFELLESAYSTDKKHIYFYGTVISDKPADFKIIYRSKNNGPRNTFSTDGTTIFKGKNGLYAGQSRCGFV